MDKKVNILDIIPSFMTSIMASILYKHIFSSKLYVITYSMVK